MAAVAAVLDSRDAVRRQHPARAAPARADTATEAEYAGTGWWRSPLVTDMDKDTSGEAMFLLVSWVLDFNILSLKN